MWVTETSHTFSDTCALIVTQTGTMLLLSGHCQGVVSPVTIRGTIDPSTGSFSGSGTAGACGAVTVNGSVVSDSASFTGEFDCTSLRVTGGVNASRCGNGQIDPGETCDDGNLANNDCCSKQCTLNGNAVPCADDGSPCTVDTCNGAGLCQHVAIAGPCNDGDACTGGDTCVTGQCVGTPLPEDAGCDDGNICTTGDKCSGGTCTADPVVCPACLSCQGTLGCVPAITNGCRQSPAHALVLRRLGMDAVSWRWDRGEAVDDAALGDPTTTTDYDFCIYDGSADQTGMTNLAMAAQAPAGSDWHPTTSGFAYDRRDLAPDGLRRVLLKAGDRGSSRLRVKGLGENLHLPQLQSLQFPLTVQLKSRAGASAQCWSARYERPAVGNPLAMRTGLTLHPPDTRPNILVIQLDDTRADGIDRMPTLLSRVAAQGVSFTNSFAVNPLCSPSRAALLSGLYGRHNGVLALGGTIGGAHRFRESGADRQTVAVWLQSAGYMTGLFGKYVNGYGFAAAEKTLGPGGTYYVPPGWTRWRGMASPEHFGGVQGGTYTLIDEHGIPTVYDDHATDQQYSTDLLGAQVRTFMTDAVTRGQPFLAVWTPYASHAEVPSLVPEPAARHLGFFRGLPPWRPPSYAEADVSDKPPWFHGAANDLVRRIFTDRMRIGAYETLLAVDEQLRLMLDRLVELGVDANTVIILTSDNGVAWGEHRIYSQNKECPHEMCLRVPMIVRDPRGSAGVVRDAAVLNIDVAPTVAALAGVVPPVPTDGMSFAMWLGETPPAQWRDDFVIEHWRGNRGFSLDYTGQVTDGDELRVLYGDTWVQPRASVLFEFDDGSGVAPGAVAVAIGVDADATFAALGAAVADAVPFANSVPLPDRNRVNITDTSPDQTNLYLLVERDQGGVILYQETGGDYFGVRDVTAGFTYVEHESGHLELYDLTVDPHQLESKAVDPSYADIRAKMAERLDALLR